MKDQWSSFEMKKDPESQTSILQPTSSSMISSEHKSKSKSPKENFRSRQIKVLDSIRENVVALSNEKRWIFSFIISLLAILVYSTFTVSLVDQFLFKKNIDLFSKESKKYEIIMNIIQFIILFIFIRIAMSYV
jgi:hypothetical protein